MAEPLAESASDETPPVSPDAVGLSARLLSPTVVLGSILLALTVLPMARCSSGSGSSGSARAFVPAQLYWQAAANHSNPSLSLTERVSQFVGQIPFLFYLTWVYWTGLPAIAAILLVRLNRRLAAWVWSALLFVFAAALLWLSFAPGLNQVATFVGSAVAILVWCRTSRIVMKTLNRIIQRRFDCESTLAAQEPIRGSFQVTLVIAATGFIALASQRESLLIGGKLAAIANLTIAIVSLVSARQTTIHPNRIPSFTILDLMLSCGLLAFGFAWLWLPPS